MNPPMRNSALTTQAGTTTGSRRRQGGQIIVLAVIGMIAMIGGVALLLEGGNAYAQQRGVQNGADAAANTGAMVLAQRLAGLIKSDADVASAISSSRLANGLDANAAYYTDVTGKPIDAAGVVTTAALAAEVGGGPNNPLAVIPPGAQGIHDGGSRTFGTSFARVLGINQLGASAVATAVTGRLSGGNFLPIVFPVNIVDCDVSGDLGIGEAAWSLSQPPLPGSDHPDGQEYIIPLCKTGSGSFMILDLDPSMTCSEEVTDPPAIQFDTFPTDVASDNGNNCAGQIVDPVNALHGQVVMIPICDGACVTTGGSNATYHIIKVASFWIDYMDDSGTPSPSSLCDAGISPNYGTPIVPIRGNGSSSCLAGWFMRYINTGPVGAGPVGNSDAIGIQLVQ
jgi:Flp pilus assembly protein TadG